MANDLVKELGEILEHAQQRVISQLYPGPWTLIKLIATGLKKKELSQRRGREDPIAFRGQYKFGGKDYSEPIKNENGLLRYLLVRTV